MIILVGGEKGGSGKSCLAQNLAVYLQASNRDILLLDADPQGTTTDWIKERDENSAVKNIPSVQASQLQSNFHICICRSKRNYLTLLL